MLTLMFCIFDTFTNYLDSFVDPNFDLQFLTLVFQIDYIYLTLYITCKIKCKLNNPSQRGKLKTAIYL